ncbi:hypothetical protein PAXRUDRAFT_181269, partial [Paxillus rubicundulus Ve08.2h10]
DWCKLQASAVNPLHPSKLRAHVKDIMGQLPSRNWHYLFLGWHKNLLISCPNGLDPKCACNFNKETLGEWFEVWRQLEKYDDVLLSSFHQKDEYIMLAGALGISQDGTVEELKTRIKNYIADPMHAADITQNPCFSGLFLAVGKSCTKNPASPDHPGHPDHTHHINFRILQSSAMHQPYCQHTQHIP